MEIIRAIAPDAVELITQRHSDGKRLAKLWIKLVEKRWKTLSRAEKKETQASYKGILSTAKSFYPEILWDLISPATVGRLIKLRTFQI